jgi:hypothetical protein
VRKVIQWTLVPVALVAVACGKGSSRAPTAMTDELKRDLQLASHTRDIQISPDEVAPKAKQELSLKTKKAPQGPKVIRTEHPTVMASATPSQAAEIKTDVPQVQVMASAPAPSETPSDDAPPLARPSASPVPTQSYPGAAPIPASNNGSVLGGIFGAVIRGGAVGRRRPLRSPRRAAGWRPCDWWRRLHAAQRRANLRRDRDGRRPSRPHDAAARTLDGHARYLRLQRRRSTFVGRRRFAFRAVGVQFPHPSSPIPHPPSPKLG